VYLFDRKIRRSHIVWVLCRGEWPPSDLDHENRESIDDRIENLRPATTSQNAANTARRTNNTSGYKGVFWDKSARRWRAEITVNRKRIHLGYYDSPEEAHAAYCVAAKKFFGEFACNGEL
jgi:hypothetical protein